MIGICFGDNKTWVNQYAYRSKRSSIVVWLDPTNDETNDQRCKFITKSWKIVNIINTFADVDERIDFATDTSKIAFVIVSMVQDIVHVSNVYLSWETRLKSEKWQKECPKTSGIHTDTIHFNEPIKQPAIDDDQYISSFTFTKSIMLTMKVLMHWIHPSCTRGCWKKFSWLLISTKNISRIFSELLQ